MSVLLADLEFNRKQFGGDHYLQQRMQPFEFAMINRWDAAAFSVLKYVSRHRRKNGLVDLQKAGHCVEIRAAYMPRMRTRFEQPAVIPMSAYVKLNDIPIRDAEVLFALESWVLEGAWKGKEAKVDQIMNGIVGLMNEYSTIG